MASKNLTRRKGRTWKAGAASSSPVAVGAVRVYTLEVFIIDGPMTKAFAEQNRVVSRTIVMRGDQTLMDLHYAIFDAFRREDEHAYEFQLGGKRPMDPKAKRYVLPQVFEHPTPFGLPSTG